MCNDGPHYKDSAHSSWRGYAGYVPTQPESGETMLRLSYIYELSKQHRRIENPYSQLHIYPQAFQALLGGLISGRFLGPTLPFPKTLPVY